MWIMVIGTVLKIGALTIAAGSCIYGSLKLLKTYHQRKHQREIDLINSGNPYTLGNTDSYVKDLLEMSDLRLWWKTYRTTLMLKRNFRISSKEERIAVALEMFELSTQHKCGGENGNLYVMNLNEVSLREEYRKRIVELVMDQDSLLEEVVKLIPKPIRYMTSIGIGVWFGMNYVPLVFTKMVLGLIVFGIGAKLYKGNWKESAEATISAPLTLILYTWWVEIPVRLLQIVLPYNSLTLEFGYFMVTSGLTYLYNHI